MKHALLSSGDHRNGSLRYLSMREIAIFHESPMSVRHNMLNEAPQIS